MTEECIARIAEEKKALARELRFFDASVWLGHPEGFPLAEEMAPDDIKQVLTSRFITGGLISHWRGKSLSAQQGNEAVLQAVRGKDKYLAAIWTGLPLFPAEFGLVPGIVDVPGEVRAVRIFPKSHGFPCVIWCMGSLCDWLSARRMPLFIWHTELDWPSLYAIAKAFPDLAIVVETQVQKILYHTRPLFALMRDCRNVFVELSNFAGQGFVEYAAREFGAERLIFGSFLPVNDPLVAIGMVIDAEISREEKGLIAGENLRRLISEA
jgi:hypothetical protein